MRVHKIAKSISEERASSGVHTMDEKMGREVKRFFSSIP